MHHPEVPVGGARRAAACGSFAQGGPGKALVGARRVLRRVDAAADVVRGQQGAWPLQRELLAHCTGELHDGGAAITADSQACGVDARNGCRRPATGRRAVSRQHVGLHTLLGRAHDHHGAPHGGARRWEAQRHPAGAGGCLRRHAHLAGSDIGRPVQCVAGVDCKHAVVSRQGGRRAGAAGRGHEVDATVGAPGVVVACRGAAAVVEQRIRAVEGGVGAGARLQRGRGCVEHSARGAALPVRVREAVQHAAHHAVVKGCIAALQRLAELEERQASTALRALVNLCAHRIQDVIGAAKLKVGDGPGAAGREGVVDAEGAADSSADDDVQVDHGMCARGRERSAADTICRHVPRHLKICTGPRLAFWLSLRLGLGLGFRPGLCLGFRLGRGLRQAAPQQPPGASVDGCCCLWLQGWQRQDATAGDIAGGGRLGSREGIAGGTRCCGFALALRLRFSLWLRFSIVTIRFRLGLGIPLRLWLGSVVVNPRRRLGLRLTLRLRGAVITLRIRLRLALAFRLRSAVVTSRLGLAFTLWLRLTRAIGSLNIGSVIAANQGLGAESHRHPCVRVGRNRVLDEAGVSVDCPVDGVVSSGCGGARVGILVLPRGRVAQCHARLAVTHAHGEAARGPHCVAKPALIAEALLAGRGVGLRIQTKALGAAVSVRLALVLLLAVLAVPKAGLGTRVALAHTLCASAVARAALALVDGFGDAHDRAASEEIAAAPLERLTGEAEHAALAGDVRREGEHGRDCGAVDAAEVLLAQHALAECAIVADTVQLQLVPAVVWIVKVPLHLDVGAGAEGSRGGVVHGREAPEAGLRATGFETAETGGAGVVQKVDAGRRAWILQCDVRIYMEETGEDEQR
mmetsp:Transcript_25334/g.65213  ORF Transcript_25334/g.65213 Transcript_25334/m.65213 type:complete len:859 (+) Transcript_25334:369-2945(+)